MVIPLASMPSHGPLMARTLLLGVVIRRCRCGMPSQAAPYLSIVNISVAYALSHGRPMGHGLPQQATTEQCRSGRPLFTTLCTEAAKTPTPYRDFALRCPLRDHSALCHERLGSGTAPSGRAYPARKWAPPTTRSRQPWPSRPLVMSGLSDVL